MYAAYKLYPDSWDGLREHIYHTKSVMQRLTGMKEDMKLQGYSQVELARQLCVSNVSVFKMVHRKYSPYLGIYLKLSEVLGWDISRDVNYAYAQVIYPPEDIKRRVMRLFPLTRHLNGACFMLESEIGYSVGLLRDTVLYGKMRSCCCYGRLMKYLQVREHEKGYADALDLED